MYTSTQQHLCSVRCGCVRMCVWYVGTNNLLESTQHQMTNSHAFDNTLSRTERGKCCAQLWEQKRNLQWQRRESQYGNAWPWCVLSKKFVVAWYMVGDDKISPEDVSSETKCCVAWQTLTSVWGNSLLQNIQIYLMTEITSHPRRNVS